MNNSKLLNKLIDSLFMNLQKKDVIPGIIIASPSKSEPDYFYHWIRDAAVTMKTILMLYKKNIINFDYLVRLFNNYIDVESKIQNLNTISGLGEPKVNVNLTCFNESWGRPQNDGPALRAIVLIDYLEILFEKKFKNNNLDKNIVKILYDCEYPTHSVIKKDLEYISNNFNNESFDLWEEIKGYHFYTLMVQMKALEKGYKLAYKLDDYGAYEWYKLNYEKIKYNLSFFYNDNRIISSYKNLENYEILRKDDSSIILAYLHTDTEPDIYLQNTIIDLLKIFRKEYLINKKYDFYLIGRYENDKFYGGNPWVLLSCALANIIKKINNCNFYKDLDKKIINDLLYISKLNNNHLSEQIDKDNLNMKGAKYLTWNFSEFINYLL